ncbi:hypothetical protein [Cupriavidus basilensis]|uniref:Uncharacterized protein n=1 Tax=Cupriavidus basilensis TaxID=68895 RepID=A0A0C4YLC1_9BURK|nr:hypothetical protein [Cupriavidus basilensis]AJG22809.1 hypothetical protein RR42_s1221 [Cupriavidus basilensis]
MLLSTLGAAPLALAADAVLVLDTSHRQETREAPALDLAITRFAGNASGTYYWEDGLLAEQILSGLQSRANRVQQELPDGQRVLSSRRQLSDGAERAAVLVDERGDVLAAALVHRECGKNGCQDSEHGLLSVFLRPGFDRAKAQPLVAWSQDVPEDLQTGRGEKIAKMETITLDAAHTAAKPVKLPKGFSSQVPLYPRAIVYRTAQDALSNAKARRVLRLQTTDSIEQVLAFYKQLTPPLQDAVSDLDGSTGFMAGKRKGVAFTVNLKEDRHFPTITNMEVEISE